MGARIRSKEGTVGTDAITLTEALGLADKVSYAVLAVRAAGDNTGTIYWGESVVTTTANRGGYLDAGEAVAFDLIEAFASSDEVYVIATAAGQKFHATWFD